jgi:tetratricopeptide (TPR) repeat protein
MDSPLASRWQRLSELLGDALQLPEQLRGDPPTVGPEHHHVGVITQNFAAVQLARGDYAAADSLYRRALALYGAASASRHAGKATPLLGLGRTLHARGEHGEAERLLRESLALRRSALPRGHWRIAEGEQALAECLAAQGRTDEAARLFRDGDSR